MEELVPIELDYNVFLTPSPEECLHYKRHGLYAPTIETIKLTIYVNRTDVYSFKMWEKVLTQEGNDDKVRLRKDNVSLTDEVSRLNHNLRCLEQRIEQLKEQLKEQSD